MMQNSVMIESYVSDIASDAVHGLDMIRCEVFPLFTALEEKINTLHKQLEMYEAKTRQYEEIINMQQSKIEMLQKERLTLVVAEESIVALEGSVPPSPSNRRRFNQSIDTTFEKSEIAKLKHEIQTIRSQFSNEQSTRQKMEKEKIQRDVQIREYEKTILKNKQDYSILERKLKALERGYLDLQQKYNKEEKNHSKQIDQIQKQVLFQKKELEKTVTDYKSQLMELERSHNNQMQAAQKSAKREYDQLLAQKNRTEELLKQESKLNTVLKKQVIGTGDFSSSMKRSQSYRSISTSSGGSSVSSSPLPSPRERSISMFSNRRE